MVELLSMESRTRLIAPRVISPRGDSENRVGLNLKGGMERPQEALAIRSPIPRTVVS